MHWVGVVDGRPCMAKKLNAVLPDCLISNVLWSRRHHMETVSMEVGSYYTTPRLESILKALVMIYEKKYLDSMEACITEINIKLNNNINCYSFIHVQGFPGLTTMQMISRNSQTNLPLIELHYLMITRRGWHSTERPLTPVHRTIKA